MERNKRFFVEDLADESIGLSVGEAHHAMHVMRLGAGDSVELFDGHGGAADGTIIEARHGKVSVGVVSRRQPMVRPGPLIHLAFAVPKGKRLDWLLEKVTELAVGSLTPVGFERSVVDPGELVGAKRERWIGHCVSAAKQSGLAWLPELHNSRAMGDFLAWFARSGQIGLVGSAEGDVGSVKDALASIVTAPASEICLLVGPEGGLAASEYAAAGAAGFAPVRLGRTTLRIETAAIALTAATIAVLDER